MSKLQHLGELLIKPLYTQGSPNEQIEFEDVEVSFSHNGKNYSKVAHPVLSFAPSSRLRFVIRESEESGFWGFAEGLIGWSGRLALDTKGVSFDAFCTQTSKDGIVVVPAKSGVTVSKPSSNIKKAVIHLFNFPNFKGTNDYVLEYETPTAKVSKLMGRVVLETDGWSVTISSIRDTTDLLKSLKGEGGYVISHVGEIRRTNDAVFSSKDLEEILQCLHHFLSFALGRRAGIALPIGYDERGERVFEEWGIRMTAADAWHGSGSWFDSQHGELLHEVFPGFYTLWNSELWGQSLSEVLYWYLSSNNRMTGMGVDAGLILSQTALELLAWVYCVQERKMVSERAFQPKGLSAADKLRLLVSSLNIPSDIPACLKVLNSKPGKKWSDGVEALTQIRNSLVHPSKSKLPDGSYVEAWKLAQWYIELAILRMCKHEGQYANRLSRRWVGTLEDVPWQK